MVLQLVAGRLLAPFIGSSLETWTGIIGAFLAVIFSLGAALTAEATDQSVRGSRDLVAILETAPLAIVPQIRNSRYMAGRRHRVMRLAISMLIGFPVMYGLVRLAFN